MKQASVVSLILGFVFFVFSVAAPAQDHQIPVAPQEYLDMENPIDEDDVDDDFLKKASRLYKSKCKKCHGAEGDGEGSAAEEIEDPKPTAFNTPDYLEGRQDGQLFWIIMHGSEGTEMNEFGPESDAGLSEEKIWQLVSYMRAKFSN
jgi:mono/diheme cytochrome c family protein